MKFDGKTYWLIGASEGLGKALSRLLSESDARVILSARSQEKLEAIAAELDDALVIPMDVTDPLSVAKAAHSIKHVDGLVYLAGAYEPMNARDWRQSEVRKMVDVNFIGATEVLSHLVPKMLAQEHGHIVLIGSLGAYRGLPSAIGYGASKAALLHLGENLMSDLKNTAIKIQVINPGFIETRLTAKNQFKMPQIMQADEAARHIVKHMKSKKSISAFPAPFAWLFSFSKFIPRAIFLRLFK